MALQDLTPQLRTRMTRVERWVGLFVAFAALLMAVAFAYYLYRTGERRGWFINKIPYYCYARDATGLKVGDPVRRLGREVGRIVKVEASAPDEWFLENNYNIFVKFEIWEPYFGYIWTDSEVHILSSDFFGSRHIEIVPGEDETPFATVLPNPNFAATKVISDRNPKNGDHTNYVYLRETKEGVWLVNVKEAPAMAQRAEEIVRTIANGLPHLTNQIAEVLAHGAATASNANLALQEIQPVLTNLQVLTARLQSEDGLIGRMLLTTNLQSQVETTLGSMDATLTNTTALIRTSEEQLRDLTGRIALTLDSVALVTSNLSAQVGANSLMLTEISSLVVSAEDMVSGLKNHWLLRSAFQSSTNPAFESVVLPSLDSPVR